MVKMYADTLPYIRAIEVLVQDAFPGRKVKVWAEQSAFRQDMRAVIACVDQYGAVITEETIDSIPEQQIASALIGMIQDHMKAEKAEGGEE